GAPGRGSSVTRPGGVDSPAGGGVLWNGPRVASRRAWARLRRKDIGIVFQEFHLLPTLTARENVEIALMGHGIKAEDRRVRAETALARVGLGHRVDNLPHALSGGGRPRGGIAAAQGTHTHPVPHVATVRTHG